MAGKEVFRDSTGMRWPIRRRRAGGIVTDFASPRDGRRIEVWFCPHNYADGINCPNHCKLPTPKNLFGRH